MKDTFDFFAVLNISLRLCLAGDAFRHPGRSVPASCLHKPRQRKSLAKLRTAKRCEPKRILL